MKTDKVGKENNIKIAIEALHLENLPAASKVNLACTLGLLVALIAVIAEPVLAYVDSIVVSICNTIISVLSNRELLPKRSVDIGLTTTCCTIAFVLEIIFCPLIVFLLDGFKNKKNDGSK